MSTTVNETFSTFRDPAGQLSLSDGYAIRLVRRDYATAAREFLQSSLYAKWQSGGDMVGTEVISDDADGMCLRHPRLFVASYPWEWTAPQWVAAAELTLRLCDEAIQQGLILKDATPLNVLFDGPRPIFVDVLSFEKRDPESPIWLAYGQFVRTFLLPLIAHQRLGWPLAASMLSRDGYEPLDLYKALPWFAKLHPRLLWPVTLPALLEKKADSSAPVNQAKSVRRSSEMATQVLRHSIAKLRRQVRQAVNGAANSHWARYTQTASHYSSAEAEKKQEFVARILQGLRPQTVLDIGCNTGTYSRIAANSGSKVVSLDSDQAAVAQLWRRATESKDDILPLVANIARPTPAVGWENGESFSLLERFDQKFDLVMMLAVVHHLLLSEQIPLDRIAALVSRLSKKWLILEWVPPSDPMFQRMLRGREDLYGSLNEEHLLHAFSDAFEVKERFPLTNGRVLFFFRAKEC